MTQNPEYSLSTTSAPNVDSGLKPPFVGVTGNLTARPVVTKMRDFVRSMMPDFEAERPVSQATLARAIKETEQAEVGPPGAKGTRKALEDNAERWAAEYSKQAAQLKNELQDALHQAHYWDTIAKAHRAVS